MKIKVPGCSVCKVPYDWSEDGIIHDSSKTYLLAPLCKNDEKDYKHPHYIDILIEVEVKE